MIKEYYYLAKPGIIYGNLISTTAGFLLASRGQFHPWLFLATLSGISLVMASGCVFNNLLDRDIDQAMTRTKNRALVTKTIPTKNAQIYASVLGLLGFLLLGMYTTFLATVVALIGLIVYVLLYTPLKRRTIHATLVGAIAGAVPPVVGYLAVTNRFDIAAGLLFAILVLWQMPHFYSIAIYRLSDYTQATIPVMPVKKGLYFTKINILIYIMAFTIVSSLLTVFAYTNYVYLTVAILLGFAWLYITLDGFHQQVDTQLWARKMFKFSLIVLLLLCFMISLDSMLPLQLK